MQIKTIKMHIYFLMNTVSLMIRLILKLEAITFWLWRKLIFKRRLKVKIAY